jgi:hypothetical protein
MPGTASVTSETRKREQTAPRRVTLSLRRGVGQVESSGRERLMMDGKANKVVKSEIHSPEAHRANSAVWV